MSLDEAKQRFGCLRKLFDDIDKQRKSIEEQVVKYCDSNVSDAAKERAHDIQGRILEELGRFEEKAVLEVEDEYPDIARVESGIANVSEEFDRRVEECWRQPPGRGNDC